MFGWKNFIEYNGKLARKIWDWQNAVLCFLTDCQPGDKTVVMACGLAGTIYLTKEKRQNAKSVQDTIGSFRKVQSELKTAKELLDEIRRWKELRNLFYLFKNPEEQRQLSILACDIKKLAEYTIELVQSANSPSETEKLISQNNFLLDSVWAIDSEILEIIKEARELFALTPECSYDIFQASIMVTSVLRGIDKKLETRGRDSCGISIMLEFSREQYINLESRLREKNLCDELQHRREIPHLGNFTIDIGEAPEKISATFTYKVASPIGQLGDNVDQLKRYLRQDILLREMMAGEFHIATTIAHTRWASQGIVSLENCHPVDNRVCLSTTTNCGHIYAVLNGDIDNHIELRRFYENGKAQRQVSSNITTDAKIIPLMIEHFVTCGKSLLQAFLHAVNEFRGSFAIEMHSDMEPGKIYLAQQGKGQGLYVGISPDSYHVASEIYGFVEATPYYIPMKSGQVFVLDQNSEGGIGSIRGYDFQGNPIELAEKAIVEASITTRDIFLDANKYSHFLEKEIHESSQIIAKTIRGKWQEVEGKIEIKLADKCLPTRIAEKMMKLQYRKILFLGMGTAHAAAQAVATIFQSIFGKDCQIQFESIVATEFTATYRKEDRRDTLAIAVSQSGGTTDTNTALRKLKEDRADLLGIVNKRDSDMTFIVDGVFYTGDGRDVEIAVASTKAFYAQVAAGTMYALAFAQLMKIDSQCIEEIARELLALPSKLQELFRYKSRIASSAEALAPKHAYWDTLSSGTCTAVSREVMIKLSELCYMSIPEFVAANKKHINLSAEALILCFFAAIAPRGHNSLAKDLQGEVAIFLAQSNVPVVFTTTDDDSFDDVFPDDKKHAQLLKVVPPISCHLAVILNTAAGHLWAYYAAKALNKRSEFVADILEEVACREAVLRNKGVQSLQILHDKDFREALQTRYILYKKMMGEGIFNNGFLPDMAFKLERMWLLAMGTIPLSAGHLFFEGNWGADSVLRELKNALANMRMWLYRSIDAIKHQAKYITVGVTGFEGIANMKQGNIKEAFYTLIHKKLVDLDKEDINEYDMITLTNIQSGIREITGGLLYDIIRDDGKIYLQTIPRSRFGETLHIPSFYDHKQLLRGGRKGMAVKNDKIHIGYGRDQSHAIVIPLRSLGSLSKLLLLRFVPNENLCGREKVQLLGGIATPHSKAGQIFTTIQESLDILVDKTWRMTEEEIFAALLEPISVETLLMSSHESISETILGNGTHVLSNNDLLVR